jgi:hypothetical protein
MLLCNTPCNADCYPALPLPLLLLPLLLLPLLLLLLQKTAASPATTSTRQCAAQMVQRMPTAAWRSAAARQAL